MPEGPCHILSLTSRLFSALFTRSASKAVRWAFSSLLIIAGESFSILRADSEVQTANVVHSSVGELGVVRSEVLTEVLLKVYVCRRLGVSLCLDAEGPA
jgi:hypothetical protein